MTVNQILAATIVDVVLFFFSFFLIEVHGGFGVIALITFIGAMIIPALKPRNTNDNINDNTNN